MTILLDGLAIFNAHAEGIFLIIVPAFGLGCWVRQFLKTEWGEPKWIMLLENLFLGSLTLIWLSFILVLLEQIWPPIFEVGRLILLAASGYPLFYAIKNKGIGRVSKPDLILGGILCTSFFLFLIVRLAFLHDIILPPYNDSPKHYKIVQGFLHPSVGQLSFYSPISNTIHFYHFGFHSLAALISMASNMDAATSIALLGQVLISLTPFSILWMTYAVTRNSWAAWVSALFAAFFWQMPYFAVNWGKYPTIAGLSLAPAIIGFWVIYRRGGGKNWRNYLILIFLTGGLFLLHSRLLICLIMAVVIYFLVEKLFLERRMQTWEIVVLWILSLEAFVPFWDILHTYYSAANPIGFVVVALLMLLSFQALPRFSAGISLFVVGTWLASKIAIPFAGHRLVLLDPPFVETMLFIPLSLFIGIGFAILFDKLPQPAVRGALLAAFLGMVLFISIPSSFTFSPDPCCNYVQKTDITAMNWIQNSTDENAVVWIAGYKSGNYMIGTDGGVWISNLTGRNTNKLAFNFDWTSPSALAEICKKGYQEVYIYKGGMPFSFNEAQLAKQSWLGVGFESNETIIYDVSCAPH